MTATGAVAAVVLLCFFGPEESDKQFWTIIHRIRDVLDAVSYWIICASAVATVLFIAVSFGLAIFGKWGK